MTQIKRTEGAKSKRNAVISLLLVVALLITGAFAYLTATDSKTNTFTVGNVDVELWENFDKDKDGSIAEDGSETFGPESPEGATKVEDIVPNQTIEKEPWIENTGNSPAYVYMMVGIPKDNVAIAADNGTPLNDGAKSVQELFTLNSLDETNWTRIETSCRTTGDEYAYNYYVYAYNTILPADDDAATDSVVEDITTSLFESVTFKNIIDNEGSQYGPYNIPINAYAIQTSALPDGVDTAVEAWDLFTNQNGWTRTSANDPEVWVNETRPGYQSINIVDGSDNMVGSAWYERDTDVLDLPENPFGGNTPVKYIAPSGKSYNYDDTVRALDTFVYDQGDEEGSVSVVVDKKLVAVPKSTTNDSTTPKVTNIVFGTPYVSQVLNEGTQNEGVKKTLVDIDIYGNQYMLSGHFRIINKLSNYRTVGDTSMQHYTRGFYTIDDSGIASKRVYASNTNGETSRGTLLTVQQNNCEQTASGYVWHLVGVPITERFDGTYSLEVYADADMRDAQGNYIVENGKVVGNFDNHDINMPAVSNSVTVNNPANQIISFSGPQSIRKLQYGDFTVVTSDNTHNVGLSFDPDKNMIGDSIIAYQDNYTTNVSITDNGDGTKTWTIRVRSSYQGDTSGTVYYKDTNALVVCGDAEWGDGVFAYCDAGLPNVNFNVYTS